VATILIIFLRINWPK